MKALLLTNEYPPYVYGGAGVHVDYLSRELSKLIAIEVRCFGDQREKKENTIVQGFAIDKKFFENCSKELQSTIGACFRCVGFNAQKIDANVVHCHTWYTHLGGILAKLNYGIPLVITIHSLEPLRPWKREQLGHAYEFSCWVEKIALEMADAIIAVSEGTKHDVLQYFNVEKEKVKVIYNGIDVNEYHYTDSKEALEIYGIDQEKPYILFVGRITRQKGITCLVDAIPYLDPSIQVVLCAGSPDTKEIEEEMKRKVQRIMGTRKNIYWIQEMVEKKRLIELYSHAQVFCCPSIYEPFGIINLEAMACETAVIASAVGGIKEVVMPGETGYLVEFGEPDQFSKDLAKRINQLIKDPALCETMGKNGRKRAEKVFSWASIAKETVALYQSLIDH